MKSAVLTWVTGTAVFALLAMPAQMIGQQKQENKQERPPHYMVTDLGTLPGGTFSQATSLGDRGLVTGVSTVEDGTQHAVL
jgi:hypothetical protein